MPVEFEEMMSLHRYFIAADQMRRRFYGLISQHAAKHGGAPTYAGEGWNENWIFMSYWYGGLYVVVEGWRDLRLVDEEVDRLLASPNVGLLKRYRNGVFHYQRQYFDKRFVELIRDGTDVVEWVRDLHDEFGRFFLDWFESRKKDEAASDSVGA